MELLEVQVLLSSIEISPKKQGKGYAPTTLTGFLKVRLYLQVWVCPELFCHQRSFANFSGRLARKQSKLCFFIHLNKL